MVFGGKGGARSEMLVVDVDTAWSDLGQITGEYPYAITLDNEVYLQGKRPGSLITLSI